MTRVRPSANEDNKKQDEPLMYGMGRNKRVACLANMHSCIVMHSSMTLYIIQYVLCDKRKAWHGK